MRGYDQAGVPDAVREAGGEIFAVTSEPQSLASQAEDAWELSFSSIGDPHHEVSGTCRERDWLNLFVNQQFDLLKTRDWVAHPKGYFQPGVLALTSEGRVLYRWRCQPTRENVGGAAVRPTATYIWTQVKAALDRSAQGDQSDAALDTNPEMDSRQVIWPVFLMFLLAHGWFLKPKPFPLESDGTFQSQGPQKMAPRLALFAVAIIAAFAYLPTIWVVAALVAWGAFVWPGINQVHREFQSIATDESG